jgi:hypothetical protein
MLGVAVAALGAVVGLRALGAVVLDEHESSGNERPSSAATPASSSTDSAWPFQQGQCLDGPGTADATLDQYHAVDCSTPHLGEVIGLPRDPTPEFPGAAALDVFAEQACGTAFTSYAGRPFDEVHDSDIWFEPVALDYEAVHGTVLCIGTSADGSQLTRSLVG